MGSGMDTAAGNGISGQQPDWQVPGRPERELKYSEVSQDGEHLILLLQGEACLELQNLP